MRRLVPTLMTAAVLLLGAPHIVRAHGGGLNAEGCHYNRRTGDYHCHRAPSPPQAPPRRLLDAGELPASCGHKVYCTQMTSCAEAVFYFTECGLSRLDGDADGVPCEALCQ